MVDANDRIFAVIVPAPEELLQAGLNSAFLAALEEAQAGLDFVAIHAVKPTLGDCVPLSDLETLFSGVYLGPTNVRARIPHFAHESQRHPLRSRELWYTRATIKRSWRSFVIRRRYEVSQGGRPVSTPCLISVTLLTIMSPECYEEWMPKLFASSKAALAEVAKWKSSFGQGQSIPVGPSAFGFASVVFDTGASTSCEFYLDPSVSEPGMAAITSGGNYDPTAGGHIALKELKTLIELPPCATVLFPPAMVTHGHVPVHEGEHRVSITQHTSGNILAWARGRMGLDDPSSVPKSPHGHSKRGAHMHTQAIPHSTSRPITRRTSFFSLLSDLPPSRQCLQQS